VLLPHGGTELVLNTLGRVHWQDRCTESFPIYPLSLSPLCSFQALEAFGGWLAVAAH